MCEEAVRLLNEYNSAVVDESGAARKLAELKSTASRDMLIFLCNEKTRANGRMKHARDAYEHHIKTHRCGVRSAKQS
jgi:hypothetical protein